MNRTEHLLVIAMEESAELAQRISKAARFGLDQIQQDADDKPEENPSKLTNRERIREEYLHLITVMIMLDFEIFDPNKPVQSIYDSRVMDAKEARIEKYFERSRANGTLVDDQPNDWEVKGER